MLNHSISGLVAFVISIIVISILSIALRFWSRLVSSGIRYSWDDWLALAALFPALVICALILDSSKYGLGHHYVDIPPENITHMLKNLYAGNIVFDLSISFSKISALAFYDRIFRVRTNTNRAWKWSFYAVLAITIAWPIASIPFTIAQCRPVQKFWSPNIQGDCFGQFDSFVSSAVSSVIIDLMILILPLPMIFRLQMQLAKKILVSFVFVVGFGVVFMSVGRMITTAQVGDGLITDISYEVLPTLYWISAESALSIFAICLPAIFQLCKRGWQFGPRSLLSSREFSQYDSSTPLQRGAKNDGGRFQRLWHRGSNDSSRFGSNTQRSAGTYVSATKASLDSGWHPINVPLESVHVRENGKVGNSS